MWSERLTARKDPVEQDRFSKLSFGFGWVLPVDCGILFVLPSHVEYWSRVNTSDLFYLSLFGGVGMLGVDIYVILYMFIFTAYGNSECQILSTYINIFLNVNRNGYDVHLLIHMTFLIYPFSRYRHDVFLYVMQLRWHVWDYPLPSNGDYQDDTGSVRRGTSQYIPP